MRKSTGNEAASALVVMARYPEPGRVKTRLARTYGNERTCRLYLAFLQDLASRFGRQRRPLIWMVEPAVGDFASLLPGPVVCLPQRGETLADRMYDCFVRLLGSSYRFEKILLIGSDMPHIRAEWIAQAEEWLDGTDVVLGPTDDGGYYLVGMRAPHDVFRGIEMGRETVRAQTLQRVEELGLTRRELPRSFDIDEPADLERLAQLLRQTADLELPATRAALFPEAQPRR